MFPGPWDTGFWIGKVPVRVEMHKFKPILSLIRTLLLIDQRPGDPRVQREAWTGGGQGVRRGGRELPLPLTRVVRL